MPPLQAYIIDQPMMFGMIGARASFVLPLICFVVIALYGFGTSRSKKHAAL
jgi:FHS family L-fucose permease-like MFS transporter